MELVCLFQDLFQLDRLQVCSKGRLSQRDFLAVYKAQILDRQGSQVGKEEDGVAGELGCKGQGLVGSK